MYEATNVRWSGRNNYKVAKQICCHFNASNTPPHLRWINRRVATCSLNSAFEENLKEGKKF